MTKGVYAQIFDTLGKNGSFGDSQIKIKDSVVVINGVCKNGSIFSIEVFRPLSSTYQIVLKETPKTPFLTVHGNILYNAFYKSYIDTPFAQSNVIQHMVQTNFDMVVKGKYPLRMTVTNRSSNSPYFKDVTDVAFQFSQQQMIGNMRNDLKRQASQNFFSDQLKELQHQQFSEIKKSAEIQDWLNSPARVQESIEEKEKQLRNSSIEKEVVPFIQSGMLDQLKNNEDYFTKSDLKNPGQMLSQYKNSIWAKNRFLPENMEVEKGLNDSLITVLLDSKIPDSGLQKKIQSKKGELFKLQSSIQNRANMMAVKKKNIDDSIRSMNRELNELKSGAAVKAFMSKYQISRDSLTGAQRLLLSVNKISIGRSWLNYSDLTVKNISVTGINLEIAPAPFYFAVAVGKINYRYRDFMLKNNNTGKSQAIALVRAGIGKPEQNYFIVSVYNGKKESYSANVSSGNSGLQSLTGLSAEAKFSFNPDNYIIGEIAKSSFSDNVAGNQTNSNGTNLQKALNWNTRSNEAYCLKLVSRYPATGTRLSAYYRKMGQHFQSFNLYPSGTNQEAWSGRIIQQLWKQRLTMDAAIRKNDFTNPLVMPGYTSSTIFKSFQLTFRANKYPFVSIGYYPSVQLMMTADKVLTENQFNTLNGTVSYSYSVHDISMNSSGVISKFFNTGSDTGFIYYNAASYTFSHSVYIQKLMLQGQFSVMDQEAMHLVTIEPLLNYQFKKTLTVSASFKWSCLNRIDNLFGGAAGVNLFVKKIGLFQLNYDKSWLPGFSRNLIPVHMGRVNFFKEF